MEDKSTAATATTTPAAPSTPVIPMDGGYHGLPQVGSPPSALRELPALRDAPPNKREELFKLKLQLCGVIFSFDDPTSDKRGKVCLFLRVCDLYTRWCFGFVFWMNLTTSLSSYILTGYETSDIT